MKNDKREKINILDHRQQAREKISIWYGSKDNYTHGLKEVIANATDEIISNFDFGEVNVILHDDLQTITVSDNGRGINIGEETDGVKNYELLFRTLFAGTKYEENETTTTGTNGVGNTVLCYTSSLFYVESFYGGKKYSIRFEDGGEITQELKSERCNKDLHGTNITFKLDPEIYPKITYDKENVKEIVKRFSVSSSKIKLTFNYLDEKEAFFYENIKDYFSELLGNQSTSSIVHAPSTLYEDSKEQTNIELILTTTVEPIQESYLNITYLEKGGTFHDGVISGVRTFANKYCRDNKLFPKGIKSFTMSDIESSISYICVAFSNKVEFEGQTKLLTKKALYRTVAQKHTRHLLEIFEIEDKPNFKKFIDHLLAVQKHNSQMKKTKANLNKKLNEKVTGIGNRVEKLVDCNKHSKDSELFIAEGNSALGSIVLAREAENQAAYPLRGKILNCLKASYPTIFSNQVIVDLIKVLGCGISTDRANKDLDSFDIKKLRYGKIIIATDSDSDGEQIACLIITLFHRLMPDLLKEGHVYIAQTPLYEIKLENDEMIYFFSETEKDQKLPKIKGKYVIARCKGLGELDALTMSETAMNPETRNLVQVTVEDADKMIESLETWMGIAIDVRKDFISGNLYKYIEDLD